MDRDEPELLHYLGEAPEGPWAIFAVPGGSGHRLVSVLFPRTLWMRLTRDDPFSSEMQLLETWGRRALAQAPLQGPLPSAIWVTPDAVGLTAAGDLWATLAVCGQCGRTVPAGEVLEGIKNALPPNARGETEVLVLCPDCKRQTRFSFTPLGAVRA